MASAAGGRARFARQSRRGRRSYSAGEVRLQGKRPSSPTARGRSGGKGRGRQSRQRGGGPAAREAGNSALPYSTEDGSAVVALQYGGLFGIKGGGPAHGAADGGSLPLEKGAACFVGAPTSGRSLAARPAGSGRIDSPNPRSHVCGVQVRHAGDEIDHPHVTGVPVPFRPGCVVAQQVQNPPVLETQAVA